MASHNKKSFAYNKKAVFEEQVLPLLQEANRICNENKIPYFAAYGIKMNENGKCVPGDGLYTLSLIPDVLSLQHNETCFSEFINILNGAHTVYADPSSGRGFEQYDVDEEQH